MAKNFLLELTDNGGRIHKDPTFIEQNKDKPNFFLNPDLNEFKGISPSYLRLRDGKIEAIPFEERGTVHFKSTYFRNTDYAKKALESVMGDQKEIEKDMYERIQKLEHCLDLINSETARFHRVVQSTKDLMDLKIEQVKKANKMNNKVTNVRFALVLLIIVALKLIKG